MRLMEVAGGTPPKCWVVSLFGGREYTHIARDINCFTVKTFVYSIQGRWIGYSCGSWDSKSVKPKKWDFFSKIKTSHVVRKSYIVHHR